VNLVCRAKHFMILSVSIVVALTAAAAHPWDGDAALSQTSPWHAAAGTGGSWDATGWRPPPMVPMYAPVPGTGDYLVKMAYGRTFGTCTQLDYATLELSKRVKRYPAMTVCGPAIGEVQFAVLGSYVFYYEGDLERMKRLDFHDGYELAGLPKGRFTFSAGPMGMATYVESGAGMSYVSETFRNSGSRWNWSLLGGMGLEKCLGEEGIFSIGVQWRHLSNGNMWGKGDELHNSNSGTDMIQGLATFIHQF